MPSYELPAGSLFIKTSETRHYSLSVGQSSIFSLGRQCPTYFLLHGSQLYRALSTPVQSMDRVGEDGGGSGADVWPSAVGARPVNNGREFSTGSSSSEAPLWLQ